MSQGKTKGTSLRTYLLFLLFVAAVGFQQLVIAPQDTSSAGALASWGSSVSNTQDTKYRN